MRGAPPRSMLLLVTLPTVLAGAPTLDHVTIRYTTPLRVVGEGADLRLVDPRGDEVPTDDALVMLGRAEDAAAYARARTWRQVAGYTLGGIGTLGALSALQAAGITDDTVETPDPSGVAAGLLVAGVAGGGAGLVFGVVPRRHLGGWMDAPTVERVIAARNAEVNKLVVTATGESVPAIVAEAKARQSLAPYVLELGADGRVFDGRGRERNAHELAGLWGDRVWLADLARQRRVDGTRWGVVGAVGGGVAVIGCVTGIGGILTHYAAYGVPEEQHLADRIMLGSGIVGATGLALAGAGLGGWFIADAWHEEPRFWFSEAVLAREVQRHNASVLAAGAVPSEPSPSEPSPSEPSPSEPSPSEPPPSEPAPPARRLPLPVAPGRPGGTSLRVVPVVGPVVGIAGTF